MPPRPLVDGDQGLLGAIALLYVVSIPWYRQTAAVPDVVWGLPDWVAVALGCYVAVAVLNSLAWWLTEVRDEEPAGEAVRARDEPGGTA